MNQWYEEELLSHYRSSIYKGHMEHPSWSSNAFNPSCGDSLRFQGRMEGDRLMELKFEGVGCVISQATASLLAHAVIGKTTAEIQALTADDIMALLKMPLGPNRARCALLSLEALRAGMQQC